VSVEVDGSGAGVTGTGALKAYAFSFTAALTTGNLAGLSGAVMLTLDTE
jgi:hypothetical protein